MDWKNIIKSIAQEGFTQREIADFCGCAQSHIAALSSGSRGKRLNYETGVRLLEMRDKAVNKKIISPRRKTSPFTV